MKIQLSRKLKQMASALLVTMVLGGILCLFVMYYLSLIQQQNTLSVRSQAWNIAIAVTEAGIEDGLQVLNSKAPPSSADGWTQQGTLYWRTNTLPGGNWYTVSLYPDIASVPRVPIITARAYIALPLFAAAPSSTFFASVGSGSSAGTLVTRAVRVTCGRNPTSLFTAAMVSKHAIDLKGNGVSSDSFDSSNPAKSTNGKYDANKYQGDFGDVATNDGIIVGVGNANIYGKLHTAPEGGYDLGANGGVGTHAWQAANGGGMQPEYFLQDANFTFPDTTLPDIATYLTPQPGDIVVTTYPVTSNTTTTATLPTPLPWGGVTTNTGLYITVTTYTNAPGLTTNTVLVTVPFPPSPEPAGLTTNTTVTTTQSYPANGTYVGSVTTNPGQNKNDPTTYTYNQITGYTYPTYTYSYPTVVTYTYNLYQTNTVVVTNHYDNVLEANHNYVSSALTGNSIVLGSNVKLVLPNGLSGAENLFFNYTDNVNPGLTVYAGGTSASINGNQYINPSGFAGSLIVYCAPTVTSFTLNGNGQFTGVLVAPNANLDLNGGGNSEQDFSGSLMVNNVRLNGHFKFHWDEALGNMKSDNDARFLAKSWNEIP
jgi:hypothetical protein